MIDPSRFSCQRETGGVHQEKDPARPSEKEDENAPGLPRWSGVPRRRGAFFPAFRRTHNVGSQLAKPDMKKIVSRRANLAAENNSLIPGFGRDLGDVSSAMLGREQYRLPADKQ